MCWPFTFQGKMATKRTHDTSDPRRERRLVWWAQFACAMGQGMGAVLLTWLVLIGDHGPAAVGLCIAAGALPIGLGARAVSHRVELHDRRLLLVGAQSALALGALALAVGEEPGLAAIALVALISGLARLTFDATCLSALHHLVEEPRLAAAARDLTAHFHAGHLCGAGLAGALLPLAGPSLLLGVCAAVFTVGALVSALHHDDINLRPEIRLHLHDALDSGGRALFAERQLRPLSVATATAGAAAGGAAALLLPYLRGDLRLGPEAATVLLSGAVALGVTLIVIPRLVGSLPWRTTAACALAAHPLALCALAWSSGPRSAAIGYGVLLGAGAVLGIVVNHRRAHTVDEHLRVPIGLAGGALSARSVALGALAVGASAMLMGEKAAYLGLAVVSLAAGAAAYLVARPPLRRAS